MEKHLTKYILDHQGLQKIEINQLNDVPVLDPRELEQETREELSELYNKLHIARRREANDSEILDAIDQVVEPLLHWADE